MNNPFKKYVCIKKHDYKDCGCACLATISKQYGLKVPISKIREISGTDKSGTSALGLIEGAEKLGFSAKGVNVINKEKIFNPFPLPAIAHVVIDKKIAHYVVIHKITKKEILVADPAFGIVKYKPDDFFEIWSGVLILMTPTIKFEKGDKTKGLYSRFFKLIIPQKKMLLNIFASSLLITFLGIIGAFYFKFLLDDIIPNNLDKSLIVISIAMIILGLFKVITEYLRSKLLVKLSINIDIPLMLGYYEHVIKLPMNFFGTRQTGEIVSRFNDVTKIREAISSATITLMVDSLMAIIGGFILFNQNSTLFFITLIPIILYIILVLLFKKSIEGSNRNAMEDNAQLTSYLVESLDGVETVKSYNIEGIVNSETEKKIIKLMKSVYNFNIVNLIQVNIKGTVKSVFGICILWIGSSLVLKGSLTIGQLIVFNSLLAYFVEPIERIVNMQSTIQTAMVAAERLTEILDLDIEQTDETAKIYPKTLYGDIEIKNLDFRYGTRQNVLNDICINIKAGKKIALVGESGSGKTTISKLLMGFHECTKGGIFINDYNIKDIDKTTLREKMAYISQETFFFSGTIRKNLELAREGVTYEEIIDVCKKAQLHDYINSLPLRYETPLEENASNISGGQRQRLAIARAILRNAEIIIMDEATANLDSITEKAIQNTIDNFTKNRTTIIIAHRLSTIKCCDKIYVLGRGSILEEGSHKELLVKNGYYADLWRQQLPEEYINESVVNMKG